MVTSTKTATNKGVGGGRFPGPNGKKPGGNGWKGGDQKPKFSPATYRITMWVLLAAIVMMFAALSSVYIMLSGEQSRPVRMPRMFLVSTVLILCSSWTFQKAKRSLQRERTRAHTRWLLLTLALGLGFLISQLVGWQELARAGVYFAGHPKSTFFYLATALHGAHLIGGIGLVVYLFLRSRRLRLPLRDVKHSTWTGVVGLYWHTMDGIWLWLLALLLVFR